MYFEIIEGLWWKEREVSLKVRRVERVLRNLRNRYPLDRIDGKHRSGETSHVNREITWDMAASPYARKK